MPDEIHQVGRIFAVMDGEGRIETDLQRVVAQEPCADTVKRAGPGQPFGQHRGLVAHHARGDALDAPGYLRGRPAREGHQEDTAGVRTLDDQMGDATRQCVGLA